MQLLVFKTQNTSIFQLLIILPIIILKVNNYQIYINQKKVQMPILNQLLLILLVYQVKAGLFNPGSPDALACTIGIVNTTSGTVFWKQTNGVYCQTAVLQNRCVKYREDGSFQSGDGDLTTSLGCLNKSITQLCSEGRCFNFVDSETLNQATSSLRQQINPLQQLTQSLTTQLNQTIHSLTNLKNDQQKWQQMTQKLSLQLNQNQIQTIRAYQSILAILCLGILSLIIGVIGVILSILLFCRSKIKKKSVPNDQFVAARQEVMVREGQSVVQNQVV